VPNAKGAERAVEAGVDEICVFVSASESHNRKNVNRSVDESLEGFEEVMKIANGTGVPVRGAIATAFGCPFEGNVPVEQVGRIAERFVALGMQGVGLGDTTGMATPPLVVERCRHLAQHQPDLPRGEIGTGRAAGADGRDPDPSVGQPDPHGARCRVGVPRRDRDDSARLGHAVGLVHADAEACLEALAHRRRQWRGPGLAVARARDVGVRDGHL